MKDKNYQIKYDLINKDKLPFSSNLWSVLPDSISADLSRNSNRYYTKAFHSSHFYKIISRKL